MGCEVDAMSWEEGGGAEVRQNRRVGRGSGGTAELMLDDLEANEGLAQQENRERGQLKQERGEGGERGESAAGRTSSLGWSVVPLCFPGSLALDALLDASQERKSSAEMTSGRRAAARVRDVMSRARVAVEWWMQQCRQCRRGVGRRQSELRTAAARRRRRVCDRRISAS